LRLTFVGKSLPLGRLFRSVADWRLTRSTTGKGARVTILFSQFTGENAAADDRPRLANAR
jgi:hypothetical protein